MSAEDLTRWTCDRCGATTETSTGRAPGAWAKAKVWLTGYSEPKASDLCNPCEVRLRHHFKRDASWALYDHFFDLALDYFQHPAGTAGNKERGDLARAACKRAYDYEMDSTPFWEAGFFTGDSKDWFADGSITGTPEAKR